MCTIQQTLAATRCEVAEVYQKYVWLRWVMMSPSCRRRSSGGLGGNQISVVGHGQKHAEMKQHQLDRKSVV